MREQEVTAMLALHELDLPPLTVDLVSYQPTLDLWRQADWYLDISWGRRLRRYAVEYTPQGTPQQLQNAQAQIRSLLGDASEMLPMVMAPYLSEAKLNDLAEREMSALDLCGNAIVIAPGDWSVYRTGNPNRFPARAWIKKVYAGTSSLVCRVLLKEPRFVQMSNIREAVETAGGAISQGTVSKVVKVLEEELLVSRRDGIVVLQPNILLERLVENWSRPPGRSLRGKFGRDREVLSRASEWASSCGAKLAVSGSQRYGGGATSDVYPPIYTDRPDEFAREFNFDTNPRFADAEIRSADDPLTFFDSEVKGGVSWQSQIQTYIEMMQGDKRDRELAKPLGVRILEQGR